MGVISIYTDNAEEATEISNVFIDEYMQDANDAQLKIYLYLVRMMSSGLRTSVAEMADLFNYTEKEVLRSLHYWERRGLLTLQSDKSGRLVGIQLREPEPPVPAAREHQVISITPLIPRAAAFSGTHPEENFAQANSPKDQRLAATAAMTEMDDGPSGPASNLIPRAAAFSGTHPEEKSAEADQKADEEKAAAEPDRRFRPETVSAEQLEAFRSDEHGRQLLLIAEQYIGKPLSLYEAQSICCFSEVLGFSDELIDFLLEYCLGLGKRDFHYIGRVAQNWAEQGISTTDQAQKFAAARRPARRRGRKSAAGTGTSGAGSGGRFCEFEQNAYDFAALEEQLLNS